MVKSIGGASICSQTRAYLAVIAREPESVRYVLEAKSRKRGAHQLCKGVAADVGDAAYGNRLSFVLSCAPPIIGVNKVMP